MSLNSAVESTGFALGAEWAYSLVTETNWRSRAFDGGGLAAATSPGARSIYAPALTSPRGAAHGWLRLRSFDSPALVFSTVQNLSGRRATASWKGGAPVRMRVVLREAVLSDVRQVGHIVYYCAGEWGADCGSKVLGRCERGKGASASEAVAEYSMVGRAKAGASARRGCCGSRAH